MQGYSPAFGDRSRGIEKRKAGIAWLGLGGVGLLVNGTAVWKEKNEGLANSPHM